MKKFVSSALKTALYLVELSDQASDGLRGRVSEQLDDVKDRVQDTYRTVSRRTNRAAHALLGDETHVVRNAMVFAGGMGAGLALGVIFAPARGEETRQAIVERVEKVGAKARRRFSSAERRRVAEPADRG